MEEEPMKVKHIHQSETLDFYEPTACLHQLTNGCFVSDPSMPLFDGIEHYRLIDILIYRILHIKLPFFLAHITCDV
jgi:hypothetical protein